MTINIYTPGHRDICGSLGHNVMTYAEPDAYAVSKNNILLLIELS